MAIFFDYSRLLGRIKEKGHTQITLGEQIGISPSTLNLKLSNKRAFRQEEIVKICGVLDIPLADIPLYFFCLKTSENGSLEKAG